MNYDREILRYHDKKVVMYIKVLLRVFGCHIDFHKMVRADVIGCFNTHPAWAIRVVLWGGYVEEIHELADNEFHGYYTKLRTIRPGFIGIVRPEFCHRLQRLRNGKASYSLWFRGPAIAPILLRGDGWPRELLDRSADDEGEFKCFGLLGEEER